MSTMDLPRYLKLRREADGRMRPRWEPGVSLRDAGWKGRDLRNPAGGWLGLEDAIKAAAAINDEVDTWRNNGQPRRRARPEKKNPRSVEALWEEYQKSPKFLKKAPVTQRDYASKAALIVAEFGPRHVEALAKHHLYAWWERLHTARGHAMANGTLAVFRLVLSYGVLKGWLSVNPALKLGLEGLEPRCVVWSPSEIAHLVATADTLGELAIGDAIVLALHTGQRQGDIRALEMPQVEAGRARFRQGKTNARVTVPITPALEERIAAIRRRRAGSNVVPLGGLVVLNADGEGYSKERFGDAWRAVRAEAAKAMPEIASKLFLDLRDTAVTRLALADCTVPEIRAITGHSMETIHSVLVHYLALDDRMATAAIAKLKHWMATEGIAL